MYGLGNKAPLFQKSRLRLKISTIGHSRREERRPMIAPRDSKKIFCTVVRVPTLAERTHDRLARPSDLLPWADPYIARLVQNLQAEVRSERVSQQSNSVKADSIYSDLEPPSPLTESEEEWFDRPRFTVEEKTQNQ